MSDQPTRSVRYIDDTGRTRYQPRTVSGHRLWDECTYEGMVKVWGFEGSGR